MLVAAAHAGGFEVVPLVGPSSILLALMASGFNGQNFAFVGYLPAKGGERVAAIKRTEQTAMRLHQTQIFIETPYRGASLFTDLLSTLAPSTCLAIGRNLTLPNEYIASRSVKEWREITKNNTDPHLAMEAWQHSPAIFLVDEG